MAFLRCARWPVRLALLPLAGACLPALALQPLVTDDTGTQGAGAQQIELSLSRTASRSGPSRSVASALAPTYTYGVVDALDVYASQPFLHNRSEGLGTSGWGNAAIGAKWRFYENEGTGTSLGIKPELQAQVGEGREGRGLGTGRTSGQLSLLASQQLPFGALHLNYAWGRQRMRDPEATATGRRLSAALVWKLDDAWSLVGDLGVQRLHDRGGQRQRSGFAELGIIHALSPQWDIALGVIGSRDRATPANRATTGTVGLTGRF
ncbi:transporter [uncultured Pseudacidovorax sp.]|uniref:transporter n=1 Tax=uncultured Pseudacidovorax sp. TaxID=679313 RepID=UPI0025EAA650|nr:transporter [uncultured Pseudacidovorax sp.]